MPGFDGTGPMGMGPRTGGGRGFCPPYAGPYYGGYAPQNYGAYGYGPVYGRGRGGIPWGGGGGRGRGFGRWGAPPAYGYQPYGAYGPYTPYYW
jgi:hypothetical protein